MENKKNALAGMELNDDEIENVSGGFGDFGNPFNQPWMPGYQPPKEDMHCWYCNQTFNCDADWFTAHLQECARKLR